MDGEWRWMSGKLTLYTENFTHLGMKKPRDGARGGIGEGKAIDTDTCKGTLLVGKGPSLLAHPSQE